MIRTFAKRLANLALDAAAFTVACVCDNYPCFDEKLQLAQLRLILQRSYVRIHDLEQVVANYRAMHELQHGPTIHLPLTLPPNESDPHDLN